MCLCVGLIDECFETSRWQNCCFKQLRNRATGGEEDWEGERERERGREGERERERERERGREREREMDSTVYKHM